METRSHVASDVRILPGNRGSTFRRLTELVDSPDLRSPSSQACVAQVRRGALLPRMDGSSRPSVRARCAWSPAAAASPTPTTISGDSGRRVGTRWTCRTRHMTPRCKIRPCAMPGPIQPRGSSQSLCGGTAHHLANLAARWPRPAQHRLPTSWCCHVVALLSCTWYSPEVPDSVTRCRPGI